jgi:hypothetical protein
VQNGGTITADGGEIVVSGDFLLNSGTTDMLSGGSHITAGDQVTVGSGGTLRLTEGGVTATGGLAIASGGRLEVYSGIVTGNLTNAGTISLHDLDEGNPDAVLSLTGNFTQASTGLLIMDITYSYGDVLYISDEATFGGTLQVLTTEELTPGAAGFALIEYGSRFEESEFDSVLPPPVTEGVWDVDYDDETGAFVISLNEEP